MSKTKIYDVVVIGGGVVGCAILRYLSQYQLKILLLEKEADLAEGISKANSGVIHAGFNVPEGTMKARMNVRGLELIYDWLEELNVSHRKTGKLVVGLTDDDKPGLEALKARGEANGTPDLEIVDADRMHELEPLAAGKWALYSPHTGILSPYQFTVAMAECAWQNGAEVQLEAPVTAVARQNDGYVLDTPQGRVHARWVVNSAGLFSDEVARLAGITDYTLFPYRGEYHITDTDDTLDLKMPVYPVPPKDGPGLGVHITPTIDGNILLGPSAAFIDDRENTASTKPVMEALKAEAYDLIPQLLRLRFIHSFAGIRPKLVDPNGTEKFKDFVIEEAADAPYWINLIGIESPGLTGSPAIAEYVAEIISGREKLLKKSDFQPERPPVLRFSELDDATRYRLVADNPDWGEMVCRCEKVTKAEVLSAIHNPFGVKTLDGIKRRTRCGMGRCQGGFCTPRIVEIMQEEGIGLTEITKKGSGSELFLGRIKT